MTTLETNTPSRKCAKCGDDEFAHQQGLALAANPEACQYKAGPARPAAGRKQVTEVIEIDAVDATGAVDVIEVVECPPPIA